MSRHVARPTAKRQDRSTLYGVFAILALLPAAFAVAFEYSAKGITSDRPWVTAAFPLVLLVAARFIPSMWRRSALGVWLLVTFASAVGAMFAWHLIGLLGYLGVTSGVRFVVSVAIAVMYGVFGAFMGWVRDRSPYAGPGGSHRTPDTGSVRRPESISR